MIEIDPPMNTNAYLPTRSVVDTPCVLLYSLCTAKGIMTQLPYTHVHTCKQEHMTTQRSYAPDVNNLYPGGVPILAEIASHYKVHKDTHTIDYGNYIQVL